MSLWGDTALEWCTTLAEIVETAERGSTGFLSPTHQRLHDQLTSWLTEADLVHWRDAAGNLWGRLPAEQADAPVVILGAPLATDTQTDPFISALSAVLPLLVVRSLQRHGTRLPFHLDLVTFPSNARYGVPDMGSRAIAGDWDGSWSRLCDDQGIPLAEALNDFGLDAGNARQASRQGNPILAYLETRLEQGPVLDYEDEPVGIITALPGARRFSVVFNGIAGHAGNVPMHLRQDALAAAAEFVLIVERVAREHGVVGTVSRLESHPGEAGVITGQARLSLDVRSEQDSSRDAALSTIWETARLACQERQIEMEWVETLAVPAIACDDHLQLELAHAIERVGLRPRYLVSGSSQDTAAAARLSPVALLLVRCLESDSHQGDGEISAEDIDVAGQVLKDWVLRLAHQNQGA